MNYPLTTPQVEVELGGIPVYSCIAVLSSYRSGIHVIHTGNRIPREQNCIVYGIRITTRGAEIKELVFKAMKQCLTNS